MTAVSDPNGRPDSPSRSNPPVNSVHNDFVEIEHFTRTPPVRPPRPLRTIAPTPNGPPTPTKPPKTPELHSVTGNHRTHELKPTDELHQADTLQQADELQQVDKLHSAGVPVPNRRATARPRTSRHLPIASLTDELHTAVDRLPAGPPSCRPSLRRFISPPLHLSAASPLCRRLPPRPTHFTSPPTTAPLPTHLFPPPVTCSADELQATAEHLSGDALHLPAAYAPLPPAPAKVEAADEVENVGEVEKIGEEVGVGEIRRFGDAEAVCDGSAQRRSSAVRARTTGTRERPVQANLSKTRQRGSTLSTWVNVDPDSSMLTRSAGRELLVGDLGHAADEGVEEPELVDLEA